MDLGYHIVMTHGTGIADYYRCKKQNETACLECKAAAAAYRREQVKKNPALFNAQKRAYYRKYPQKRKALEKKREMKLRGVKSTSFTEKDIIDLWGTDCHLCGKSIYRKAPRSAKLPGWEESFTQDHVIPISKGGPHIITNVKPAHPLCNIRKSNKLATA